MPTMEGSPHLQSQPGTSADGYFREPVRTSPCTSRQERPRQAYPSTLRAWPQIQSTCRCFWKAVRLDLAKTKTLKGIMIMLVLCTRRRLRHLTCSRQIRAATTAVGISLWSRSGPPHRREKASVVGVHMHAFFSVPAPKASAQTLSASARLSPHLH